MMPSPPATPRWFTVLVIVATLPVFQMPWLLSVCQPESSALTMIWIYPVYALVAAYLAWQCYPQRHAMAWILVVLLLLSHFCLRILATTSF